MRLRTAVTSLAATTAVFAGGVLAASPASASTPVQNGCQPTSFVLYAVDPNVGYCWNDFPGSAYIGLGNVDDLNSGAYSGYIIANGTRINFTYHQNIPLDYVLVTDVTLLYMD
jgi:hypothetical protein